MRLFGLLERLAGRREASVEVEAGATLLEVLALLADACGPDFQSAVFRTPGEAQTNLRLFLNQEEASPHDRLPPARAAPDVRLDILALTAFEGGGL